MKITISLPQADALLLIKLLSGNKEAAAIVKDLQALLNKNQTNAMNKLIM